MALDWCSDSPTERTSRGPTSGLRASLALILMAVALANVPIVTAHESASEAGVSQWHGVGLSLVGIAIIIGAVWLKREDRIGATNALSVVFVGIVATAVGAVLFEGLSPDPVYTARSMPFPRSWYPWIGLGTGLVIAAGSFAIGWLRWPSRPRYAFLGMLMGLWVSYPYLLPRMASDRHPLGYALVVGTPIAVGYVVWTDAGAMLRTVLMDPVSRRFGIGVGGVVALFFVAASGYLSFFPEPGGSDEMAIVVLPVLYQLVTWPTLEIALPQIPLFLALSPGLVLIVGTLSTLIGLNAAVIARRWRAEERAGVAQGTAGSAAIVGACTCGCCGPLVANIAILAAGPAVAAPLYWVFVDAASPISTLFVVGSILLFTTTLIHSIEPSLNSGRSEPP